MLLKIWSVTKFIYIAFWYISINTIANEFMDYLVVFIALFPLLIIDLIHIKMKHGNLTINIPKFILLYILITAPLLTLNLINDSLRVIPFMIGAIFFNPLFSFHLQLIFERKNDVFSMFYNLKQNWFGAASVRKNALTYNHTLILNDKIEVSFFVSVIFKGRKIRHISIYSEDVYDDHLDKLNFLSDTLISLNEDLFLKWSLLGENLSGYSSEDIPGFKAVQKSLYSKARSSHDYVNSAVQLCEFAELDIRELILPKLYRYNKLEIFKKTPDFIG